MKLLMLDYIHYWQFGLVSMYDTSVKIPFGTYITYMEAENGERQYYS